MKDPAVSSPNNPNRSPRAALIFGILIALSFGCCWGAYANASNSLESALGALQQLDYDAAAKILNHLAASGDVRAKAALSTLIEAGILLETYPTPAIDLLRDAAESGLPEAALELGNRYYLGTDEVQQNDAEAVRWWTRAAERDSVPAAFNIGLAFAQDHGQKIDLDGAKRWFSRAAQGGSPEAQFALGVLSVEAHDYPAAFTHFKTAAGAGSAFAAYNLGAMYEQGLGTHTNLAKATEWYQRAAATNLQVARDALQRFNAPLKHESKGTSPHIHGSDWVREQAADRFVVQVATGISERGTIDILGRYADDIDRAYFKISLGGHVRFLALVGSFDTYLDAIAYLNTFEPELRTNKPWVRRFGTVQAYPDNDSTAD
jgi:TPR repeat protein